MRRLRRTAAQEYESVRKLEQAAEERELVGLRQAARLETMRELLAPEPSPEEAPCRAHSLWQPQRRGPQPSNLAHECPYCKADRERSRATERDSVEIPHPLQTRDSWRFDRVWNQGVNSAGPRPGSIEERNALDRIDELREKELEAERRKRGAGRVVTQRIEDGRIVAFIAVPGRRGLVRST
jgi:hypothetical protein